MVVAPGAAVPAIGGISSGGGTGGSSGFVAVPGAVIAAIGAISAGTANGTDSGNRIVAGASVSAIGLMVGGTAFGGGAGLLLPGLAPAARNFQMDVYPQQKAKTRNGRTMRWAQANTAAEASFDLEWTAITNAEAEQILTAWDTASGPYGDVALSESMLAGLSVELRQFMQAPSAMVTWRFSERPQVTFIKTGRCTLRLKLKSRHVTAAAFPPVAAFTLVQRVPCCVSGSTPI